jgi:hypothetical protein
MHTCKKAPKGIYPGEGFESLGIKGKTRYRATGEYRAPKRGEYYLSGAVITAYIAPNDLSTEYWIAEPVNTVPQIPHAFLNLIIAVTSKGGIRGNPYCDSDVKAALKALAEIRGMNDYLDAASGITYTGEKQ